MDNKKRIITKDLYFAAALAAYGGTIEEVDRSNPKEVRFTFDVAMIQPVMIRTVSGTVQAEPEDTDRLRLWFRSGSMWLPPSYPSSLRDIKALIYAR
ncbi:hypothetical protein D6833_13420 [Candidatus Parcubacteria bacterium]|nr:MAG: hypothetical protein D6833_13420 [Candidatus Parcubacteria bacterium]